MRTMWPGDWHSCPSGSSPWAVLSHWEPESTLPSRSCFRQAFCHGCEKTKTSLFWKHRETGSGPSLWGKGHTLVGEVVRIQTNIHSSKESVQVRVWTRRVFQTQCRSVADQDPGAQIFGKPDGLCYSSWLSQPAAQAQQGGQLCLVLGS